MEHDGHCDERTITGVLIAQHKFETGDIRQKQRANKTNKP